MLVRPHDSPTSCRCDLARGRSTNHVRPKCMWHVERHVNAPTLCRAEVQERRWIWGASHSCRCSHINWPAMDKRIPVKVQKKISSVLKRLKVCNEHHVSFHLSFCGAFTLRIDLLYSSRTSAAKTAKMDDKCNAKQKTILDKYLQFVFFHTWK